MKRVLNAVLGGCLLVASCAAPKKDTITIKGKVQFPDNQFNMEIVERNGFDKTIIDSCKVNADGTYQFTMKVDRPGVYTLECQKWQSVQFWAEDEDLKSISAVWIRPGLKSKTRRMYTSTEVLTMR